MTREEFIQQIPMQEDYQALFDWVTQYNPNKQQESQLQINQQKASGFINAVNTIGSIAKEAINGAPSEKIEMPEQAIPKKIEMSEQKLDTDIELKLKYAPEPINIPELNIPEINMPEIKQNGGTIEFNGDKYNYEEVNIEEFFNE